MEYANGGSLEDFVALRLHKDRHSTPSNNQNMLKQRFRSRRQTGSNHESAPFEAVHLLRIDEIVALFRDIVSGLAYLHGQNILHCDLKADNVLLHFTEDAILPIARIADFGNAEKRERLWNRDRTGTTGTMDYLAPEALETE